MKKLTILFLALGASLNLFAQTDEPEQQQDAAVQVAKTQPEGLTLKEGTVWLSENGKATAIIEEIWTKRGMQVTPSGAIIFSNGEKAALLEGDFVTFDGAVARPIPLGKEKVEVAYNK